MTELNIHTTKEELFFVTLKNGKEINENQHLTDLFENREYCDVFVKALIYVIECCELKLYGFVILSDQIHLIVSSSDDSVYDKIEKLKRITAREILLLIGRKLNGMSDENNRKHIELRKVFNKFLNSDESIFWGQNEKFLALQRFQNQSDIQPISSDALIAHLADNKRNYLQLGADAFTKVMMETL